MSDPRLEPGTGESAGELRERIWAALLRARAVRYPLPPHGHHPNFRGAAEAAARLLEHLGSDRGGGLLRPGDTVLAYPDYVLKPLRKGLLERGIRVVVPAKYGRGYRLLEPARVPPAAASSIAGAERHGQAIDALPPLTLTAIACVALAESGDWLGKGYGFALPPEAAALPQVTIVHPLQLLPAVPEADGRVFLAATPEQLIVSR